MDVELPTIEAIKLFVSRGSGVALVPGICVEDEVASGELVRVQVKELQMERKLRLVYRKNASLSHAARAFLKGCGIDGCRNQRVDTCISPNAERCFASYDCAALRRSSLSNAAVLWFRSWDGIPGKARHSNDKNDERATQSK